MLLSVFFPLIKEQWEMKDAVKLLRRFVAAQFHHIIFL